MLSKMSKSSCSDATSHCQARKRSQLFPLRPQNVLHAVPYGTSALSNVVSSLARHYLPGLDRRHTAVLPKLQHSNCCKRVPNRPLRGRRGRLGTLLQQLECGSCERTAVGHLTRASFCGAGAFAIRASVPAGRAAAPLLACSERARSLHSVKFLAEWLFCVSYIKIAVVLTHFQHTGIV